MSIRPMLAIAAGLLASASLVAQTNPAPTNPAPPKTNTTVYACKNADGSMVFSATPCSTDPSKMRKIDTSSALRTGTGDGQPVTAANAADDDCHKAAYTAAYSNIAANAQASNQNIANYRQRQEGLAAKKVYASNGSGDLVDDPAAQQQIQDLDGSIAQEFAFQRQAKQKADAQYQAASKACDDAAALKQQNAKKN